MTFPEEKVGEFTILDTGLLQAIIIKINNPVVYWNQDK